MKLVDPVLVIGGGIGGLTLAVALTRRGIPVRVFERAPAPGEVAAGLGVWSSAVRVLAHLGIGDELIARAAPITHGEVATARGEVLSRVDVGALAAATGAPSILVHREELHRAILRALPDGVVTWGAHCSRVTVDGGGVIASLEERGPVRGALLVGADGLRSIVRDAVLGPTALRYAGDTCFRGVAALAHASPGVLREVQGFGLRASVFALDDARVAWWATVPRKEGKRLPSSERKAFLLDRFAAWPFQVADAIRATPDDGILQHDLYDRAPARAWSNARVTLLGDAAHPTTPNLGQGAGLAIEDAVTLAACLDDHDAPEPAFAAYEAKRVARAASVVRQSALMGRVARARAPVVVWARDLATRLTPRAVLERAVRAQIAFDALT